MTEKLFASKSQVGILKVLLFNPDSSYYQRQISALTKQHIRSVQREVAKLESIGLIEKSVQGNRIYYKANKKCPIFKPLREILVQGSGIAQALKEHLKSHRNINLAFIYGSFARGKDSLASDIDLMVIGRITSRVLSGILAEPKKEFGREINYAVFPANEFASKVKQKNHFLNAVVKEPKTFIIGDADGLKKIIKSG